MKNKNKIKVVIQPSGTAGERICGIFNTMSVYKDFFLVVISFIFLSGLSLSVLQEMRGVFSRV